MTSLNTHPWWCAGERCTAAQGGTHRSTVEQWNTEDGHILTAIRSRDAAGIDRLELGIVAELHPHPTMAEQQARCLVACTAHAIDTAFDADCPQGKEHTR